MANTGHARGVESSERERETSHATRQMMQMMERSAALAENPVVSPFGMLSAFWGDVDRMLRGMGMPAMFPFASGLGSVWRDQGGSGSAGGPPTWAPPLEVLTRDGEFVVRTEIPGIDKDHVNVEILEGRAIISGERQEEHEEHGEGVQRTERSYGRFSRVVALPEGANAEEAKAVAADGVLEIVIPLANPERKAHRLEIHEGGAAESESGDEEKAELQPQPRTRQAPAERHRKRRR